MTREDARKFNRLVDQCSSPDQMARIRARLALSKFAEEHGKEACDAEFEAENKRRGIKP